MKPGSAAWLIAQEERFGGYQDKIKRRKVSPSDPREKQSLKKGGMIAGDRMSVHGYAPYYEKHLKRFIGQKDLTIVECGILKGTGLAIWAELFPYADLHGLDIDLAYFFRNKPFLKECGAFPVHPPTFHQFDQFAPRGTQIDNINIFIDDGHHSDKAIRLTYMYFAPSLVSPWVYFIEDNDEVNPDWFPGVTCHRYGELTVLEG